MNIDDKKGTQVKTGEKYLFEGYWVHKDLSDPNPLYYIDVLEGVPEYHGKRAIFVYYGMQKPTKEEMDELIKNSPPYP
ncbi:hypothetical protein [Legionella sp.]|uniref:hypothetical protein n=1 Tax=Legionella sp. TaxID=459 RepID=UPI003CBC30D9